MKIVLRAFAKINLSINILGKRPDGNHEIESIIHSISLYDSLSISPSSRFRIQFTGSKLPLDKNTIAEAYRYLREYLEMKGIELPQVSVSVKKKIPEEAGLGGGSADAAAFLHGINRLFSLGLSRDELKTIGEKVGADVPFFFYGGACLVCGRGEKVFPVVSRLNAPIVIVLPRARVSTDWAYRKWDERGKLETVCLSDIVNSLKVGDLEGIAKSLVNSFLNVVVPENEEINLIYQRLKSTDLPFSLTGSGSAFFVICRSGSEVERVVRAVDGLTDEVYETFPVFSGIREEFSCQSVR